MGIFSANPKTFKMDRKSPLASNLKSSISEKLHQFLGIYTDDDVLAEYIIVLVCNGKHQNQARNDLEAFLGNRSGEFVSWLWDLLLKYFHQSSTTIELPDPKDVMVSSPHDSDADKDWRINRLRDLRNHGTGSVDSLPTKDEKFYPPSTYACNSVPSNDMEFSEGFECSQGFSVSLNEVNTKKVRSQICGSEIPGRFSATEDIHDDSLTHESSRMRVSYVIPTGGEQGNQSMDKFKKIVKYKCNGLPNQLSYFPKRELVSGNTQSSISENPHPRQICAANVSGRSLSSRVVNAVSHQNEKSRASVWDRLGKPCDSTFVRGKTGNAHGVDIIEQDDEVLDQHTLSDPVPSEELSRSMTAVPGLGKSFGGNNHPGEYGKLEHGSGEICKLHAANNIRRKRHVGEISTGLGTGSASLVGQRNRDSQYKEMSQDFKRSALTTEASETTTPTLVLQVSDVKLRLRQIEAEMSQLRTKQAEMKKDGKPNLLSRSGAVKHREEDIESRTVFVTNVHFAATNEALSLYFGKCGVVVNVVTLTDKFTAQPRGSAYITFASKESVDKAVALSGTSFFSRTIKVSRKAEVAAVASAPVQLAGKPSQAGFSHINRKPVLDRPYYSSSHLQWRRECVSAPSEPAASTIIEEKGVSDSASQQQLPSSLASVSSREAVSSSKEAPAAT